MQKISNVCNAIAGRVREPRRIVIPGLKEALPPEVEDLPQQVEVTAEVQVETKVRAGLIQKAVMPKDQHANPLIKAVNPKDQFGVHSIEVGMAKGQLGARLKAAGMEKDQYANLTKEAGMEKDQLANHTKEVVMAKDQRDVHSIKVVMVKDQNVDLMKEVLTVKAITTVKQQQKVIPAASPIHQVLMAA